MPSMIRQARFAPIPATYSRLPRDDEIYVMKAFARHCSHCSACSDPYAVHLAGRSLCSKGWQRALDVTQYVFNKAGQAFSVVDLEGNKRCQVEIPADCDAVRQLLKAIERGLRLRPNSSSSSSKKERLTSYDENYYVAPRRTTAERDLAYDLKYADSEPRHSRKSKVEVEDTPAPRYVTSAPRRFQSVKQRPTSYYEVGSRGKLPVPGRDEWYY